MDRLQRGYFRLAAENRFLKLRRQEFQAWFGQIMEKAYPDDYENIRLTQGDGGLDGILISTGTVFAVFAPRETSEMAVIDKMNGDFQAAKATMEERKAKLTGLVFVHNDEGLTKVTGPELIRLNQENSDVTFRRWTFEGLWLVLERLSVDQLEDLFGPGPTEENVDCLGFPTIREVITYLSRTEAIPLSPITLPDPDKLEHNHLSPEKMDLLTVGRRRQGLVEQYLNGLTDPTTGEEIAESFRQQYAQLKQSGMTADEIFTVLWRFTGGEHFVQPDEHAAVTAVMAYFFSSCDIFENLPGE